MKNKIEVSHDLALPIDAVTQKQAMIGRTGSGKTYAAIKIAEGMLDAGAQIIVLDPVGVYYGLRLAADGKKPGYSIPVFGGLHGDIMLEPSAGTIIADLIIDKRISAVIDTSQFESDLDKARFAAAFCNRFFFRKKAAPSAVHMFLEECQEYIPQNPQKGEEKMLHEFQRLMKLGRNFGIGATMITQRPQEVNKKALNQAECVFCFQLTGPQERKAIAIWMADKGLDLDLANDLPKLQKGEAHVWSPSWLKISRVVKIAKKKTFDASSTPEVGQHATARKLASIDLEALRDQMAATIEKQKADDPKELRKIITTISKQKDIVERDNNELRKRIKSINPEAKVKEVIKTKEVKVIDEKLIIRIEKQGLKLVEGLNPILVAIEAILDAVKTANEFNRISDHAEKVLTKVPNADRAISVNTKMVAKNVNQLISDQERFGKEQSLPPGEKAVLTALIQYPNGLERNQLTTLTGYKRSSRDAYLARLSAKGLSQSNGGKCFATQAGIDALPDFKPLPTGRELQEYWKNKLPSGEWKVLEILIEHYPKSIERNLIDDLTGFKRSSRDAYLARLSAKELVSYGGTGMIKANDNLF